MEKDIGDRSRHALADNGGRECPQPIHIEDLPDGSWLADLRKSTHRKSNGREDPVSYRLFTTLLDPTEVSAVELAAAYNERRKIELILDELKTHQRGPRMVLRSKSPDRVKQEI